MNMKEYLSNPCGKLSIPYWKDKLINLPSDTIIFHHTKFNGQFSNYERYFRLIHHLENTYQPLHIVETIDLFKDEVELIKLINKCYVSQKINISNLDINNWINHSTYNKKLWVKIMLNNKIIACGIAEYDKECKEGILEWIQVLPNYRRKGYGKSIVNSLLKELKLMGAEFVTVSGKIDNKSNPEALYRDCGFIGNDIWYICKNMNISLELLNQNDKQIYKLKDLHKMDTIKKYIAISENYFNYVTSSENVFYYKILLEGNIIGGIHIEKVTNNVYLSICIHPVYRGFGFATQTLDKILCMYKGNTFCANIEKENIKSIKLFESLNFIKVNDNKEILTYKKR